ncbi:MAG: type II secretion system protein [Rickettsiales bacterium]|nr:type II secretion system protein [Rickettsiales bacterium]
MPNKRNFRQAFSLLELSLVVIIISLLIAGATSGLRIVRKAQIQSSIKEMTNYKFMIHEFMTAYQAIPGDFDSAHSFFDNGSDDICGTSYECNGDGDGMIELDSKSNSEVFRGWQHLSLSGFADTEFDGEWNETNSVASAPLNDANISITYDAIQNDNLLKLGSYLDYQGHYSSTGLLTTKEAFEIDNKYDDGFPSTGKIIAHNNQFLNGDTIQEDNECLSDADIYQTYNNQNKACTISFLISK